MDYMERTLYHDSESIIKPEFLKWSIHKDYGIIKYFDVNYLLFTNEK